MTGPSVGLTIWLIVHGARQPLTADSKLIYNTVKVVWTMAEPVNNKVFLFFGTTGTDKGEALGRFVDWAQAQGRPKPHRVDVEEKIEGFYGRGRLYEYLDQPNPSLQKKDWDDAFDTISGEVEGARQRKDVYIAMHGALLRKDYGVRSALNFEKVALLKPDTIVTLIDDVFVNWYHTEQRAAGGQNQKGRPTLTQLLVGRQHEILIADLVVNFLEDKFGRPRRPHYVLALRHPVETLGRLLYNSSQKRTYVSFPISMPRRRLREGDSSAIDTVNSLLKQSLKLQKSHKNLVLFLPVTMDEMLLMDLADGINPQTEEMVELTLARRWPIPEILGHTLRNEATLPTTIRMPAKQVKAIAGLIDDEIRTHDFRMIDQSEKVLVLSRYCEKEESSGVSAEMDYAVTTFRKVEAYQVPSWLPNGVKWRQPPGIGPFATGTVRAEYVEYHTRLEDALKAVVGK